MDEPCEYFHLLVMPHVSSDCLASIAAVEKKHSRPPPSYSPNHSTAVSRRLTCPPAVVQAIYASCQYLKLGFDVHHLAVELFELFMVRLVKDVGEMKRANNLSPGVIVATQRQMRSQVWQRLLTCVLLAAKYQQNLQANVTQIREKIIPILRRIDARTSTGALNRSEMRVLKTLGFSLERPTLLSSTRVVVSSLVHNVPNLRNASHFLTCIGLLCNVTSLKRRCIHSSAFRKDKKVTSHEDRLVRLASAIIATAASVSLESNLCRKVTEELSFITHLPMDETLAVRDSFRSLIAGKT